MTITIERLRKQIQRAKAQLLASAEHWLSTEDLPSEYKSNWLAAVRSTTSDEMRQKLREANLSIERVDECFSQPPLLKASEADPNSPAQEPILLTRRHYELTDFKDKTTVVKLCHLTNLFEQLHHLEDLLTPFELAIPVKGLKLAHQMACSIANEWCFVEEGVQTVHYYKNRTVEAMAQLRAAQVECDNAFLLLQAPIENKLVQFAETLCFLADCLSKSYPAVKDDRYLVEFWTLRLRSYLPWQAMINDLTTHLFETGGFTHTDLNTLVINKDTVRELIQSVDKQTKEPFTEQHNEFQQLSKTAEDALHNVCAKIQYMENSNKVKLQLGEKRPMLHALMSTQRFGFFSLYQVLYAYHGKKEQQALLTFEEGLAAEKEEGLTSEKEVETPSQLLH